MAVVLLAGVTPAAQELGTITFPTSGAAAAQPAFIEGVKALHSFEFDAAAEAFRRAQKADPTFALAFWGEAMSYNHPLWAQQDVDAAKQGARAPGADARRAASRWRSCRRRRRCSRRCRCCISRLATSSRATAPTRTRWRRCTRSGPTITRSPCLYALSLLGTVRPGDTGFRRQALAASIAQKVYAENPKHPGAAHFIIHSFDDPEHAPLALPAANAYAKIAPSAAHALHMPSHIYVQLGMWQQVAASNVVAYKAADGRQRALEARRRARRLPHAVVARVRQPDARASSTTRSATSSWRGRRPSATRTTAACRTATSGMRARYILETGAVGEDFARRAPRPRPAMRTPAMPGMPGMAIGAIPATPGSSSPG